MFVHTAHGSGRIVDEQSVRGRKSFLVEGRGFKVWVDEKDLRVANDVNDDNSTTLPYDPTPQYPTDMFAAESTMQPINDLDTDERLSPADSLSFEDESLPYPGPSPDNFARHAGYYRTAEGPQHLLDETRIPPEGYRGKHRPFPQPEYYPVEPTAHYPGYMGQVWDSDDYLHAHDIGALNPDAWQERIENQFGPLNEEQSSGLMDKMKQLFKRGGVDDPDSEDFLDEEESIKHFSYRQAGGMTDMATGVAKSVAGDLVENMLPGLPGPPKDDKDDDGGKKHLLPNIKQNVENLVDDFAGSQNKKQVGGYWPGRPDGRTVTSGLYERPAGLSDKYIRIEAYTDHFSDPVQQFRDDPVGFINKRGYMLSDATDIRLAEYIDLVEHDPGIRTAAWKDVRTKALRLRREGRVHVKDIAPDRIYAAVQGDSDVYETMILKAAGNQSISDWHCSCPWGRWAFKRQMSYVGRLCSHGYASYLEMESQQMKANNKKRRKSASIVEDFKQWADNENSGKIDQNAIDNFIYFLNSQTDGDRTVVSEEDAEKLYDALDDMKAGGKVRNYDVGYEQQPEAVYKEADVLQLRPSTLTPDSTFIEDGDDGQFWADVTKDERKTTGPDNMVKKSAGYFGDAHGCEGDCHEEGDDIDYREKKETKPGLPGLLRMLFDPHTASRRLTGRELHYASDEELGHAIKDWAGASSDLEKLRTLSGEEPDFQNKREQNDQIREVINELHDRGIDASQFVASLRFAADAEEDADDDEKKNGLPASQQGQPSMDGKANQTGQPGGSSSITKPDASQGGSGAGTPTGGALSNQTNNPAAVGFNASPAADQPGGSNQHYPQSGSGVGMDPANVMSGLGQAAGGLVNVVPDLIGSIPEIANSIGQFGAGIGSGIGSVVNGLSGLSGLLHANNQHVATPIGGFPNVQLTNQESFQGSGPNPKYWMGSSECYVDDHERDRFVDVTDLDDDPLIKFTKEKPGQGPKKASRRPFDRYAYDEELRDHLLQAEGEEISTIGEYSGFLNDAQEQGDSHASAVLGEAIQDEKDHVRNFNDALKHGSENANPDGATLTSGSGINDSNVINFDQPFKSGAANPQAWDGHRVRDFRRFVKQQGGQPNHQMLQQYLNSKQHRGLDQGGKQHLQDYTAYAEQHEASRRYAMDDLAVADVPGASADLIPNDGFSDDGSDIVAAFHRMGGIEAINNSGGSGGGSYSDASIAERAQGFLRTAGRMYSLAEQRELEEESHPKGARNLGELDLRNTHYEDI